MICASQEGPHLDKSKENHPINLDKLITSLVMYVNKKVRELIGRFHDA
jgi:hypothetical protein